MARDCAPKENKASSSSAHPFTPSLLYQVMYPATATTSVFNGDTLDGA